MTRRMPVRTAGVLAGLVAVVALPACVSHAGFERRSVGEIERALGRSGLEVCTRLTNTAGLANQARSSRVLNVAADCHDEIVPIVVDRFANRNDRDAAARHLEVASRPRADGVVWTWAQYTIAAFGPRDDQVMNRITAALDRLGAR